MISDLAIPNFSMHYVLKYLFIAQEQVHGPTIESFSPKPGCSCSS